MSDPFSVSKLLTSFNVCIAGNHVNQDITSDIEELLITSVWFLAATFLFIHVWLMRRKISRYSNTLIFVNFYHIFWLIFHQLIICSRIFTQMLTMRQNVQWWSPSKKAMVQFYPQIGTKWAKRKWRWSLQIPWSLRSGKANDVLQSVHLMK